MHKLKFDIRFGVIALIILVTALSRLIPYVFESAPIYNFSPIGAIGLFGAAYFTNKKMAYAVPYLALWFSNIILDNLFLSQFYSGFVWLSNWEIYLTFGLIITAGFFLLKKVTALRVLGASLVASVVFFILSNFFVWMSGTLYPLTMEGLLTCYVAAIPFFWNTIAGDLFYSALLFGAYEWAMIKIPALRLQKA